MNEKDEKTWGMLCHLSSLLQFATAVGGILGPLIIWLIKKDESDYVDHHGKEALNFQITVHIGYIIGGLLMLVCIGVVVLIAIAVLNIVFTVIASIKANEGERYVYPFSLRLVK